MTTCPDPVGMCPTSSGPFPIVLIHRLVRLHRVRGDRGGDALALALVVAEDPPRDFRQVWTAAGPARISM